jgi:hypothetical protein
MIVLGRHRSLANDAWNELAVRGSIKDTCRSTALYSARMSATARSRHRGHVKAMMCKLAQCK